MSGRRRFAQRLSADLRDQLADEAARLMAENGIGDYGLAKRKAAERLGVRAAGGGLPSNGEIQQRLVERQRLFEAGDHDARIAKLRCLAANVMADLEAFRPRLVGPVLDGTATINAAIELHVFSDAPELVAETLQACGNRVRDSQRRYRFSHTEMQIPGFTLAAGDEEVHVMVFPERGAHHAPLSPVDGRPMRRASRAAVLALVDVSAC